MVELANTIWASGPAGSPTDPDKVLIRAWGTYLESLATLAFTSSLVYSTRAALYANLVPAANVPALVIGDPTAGYDGLYMKVGATTTGSWTRLGDVPGRQYIKATDAGAGTANAIVATTDIPLPSADRAAIISLNIYEANTASPVTVAFNGGSALTIKTMTGNDVAAGGLPANAVVAGYVTGSTFRLLSDQASAAIQAAAEAAQTAAEAAQAAAEVAAAAAVGAKPYPSRAAIKALSAGDGDVVILTEGVPALHSRAGTFVFDSSDLSTEVAADTQEGIYIAPGSDATGASGAWVRQYTGLWNIKWFGAVGDGAADDTAAFQGAISISPEDKQVICTVPGGAYSWSATVERNKPVLFLGEGNGDANPNAGLGEASETGVTILWDGTGGNVPMAFDSSLAYASYAIGGTPANFLSGGGWKNMRFNGYSGSGDRASHGVLALECIRADYRGQIWQGMTDAGLECMGCVRCWTGNSRMESPYLDCDGLRYSINPGTGVGCVQMWNYGLWGSAKFGALFWGEGFDNCHFLREIFGFSSSETPGHSVYLANGGNTVRFNHFPYIVGRVYIESNVHGISGFVQEETSQVILEPGAQAKFEFKEWDGGNSWRPWMFRTAKTISVRPHWTADGANCTAVAPAHGYGTELNFADDQDGVAEFNLPMDDEISTGEIVAVRLRFSQVSAETVGDNVAWRLNLVNLSNGSTSGSGATAQNDFLTAMTAAGANVVQDVRVELTTPLVVGDWANIVGSISRRGATKGASEGVASATRLHDMVLEYKSYGPTVGTSFGAGPRGPFDVPNQVIGNTQAGVARYAAQSVRFDGSNDYLSRGADLSNITDGKKGTLSFWIKMMGADGASNMIISNTGGFFKAERTTANRIAVTGLNAAAAQVLNIQSAANTVEAADSWVHVLASWDLGNGLAHMLINGAVSEATVTTVNDNIDYTQANWRIGATLSATALLDAEVADFFFDANRYVDLTSDRLISRFYRADGKPNYLGRAGRLPFGHAPAIWLSGGLSAWHTNKGHGGGFTQTGALTAAASSPSD